MDKKFYFSFNELIATDTQLFNYPIKMEHVANLVQLAHFLTCLRIKFGAPICVNSAFRTKEVNAAVGGSNNSYHLEGLAADIRPNYNPSQDYEDELLRLIRVIKPYEKNLKEFIIYPTFVHVAI